MDPMLCNVIFPAFTAPYLSPLLFPVAGVTAIAAEFLCYRKFSSHPSLPSFTDILCANGLSWVVGIGLGLVLPSGLTLKSVAKGTHQILAPGPQFSTYAILAFFMACLLSIVIEGWYIKWSARNEPEPLDYAYRLSALANITSYLALAALIWIWMTFL